MNNRIIVDTCDNPICSSTETGSQCFCPPTTANVYNTILLICQILFTLEFFIRFCTVWACNTREAQLVSYNWIENHTSIDIPPPFKSFYNFVMKHCPNTIKYVFPHDDYDDDNYLTRKGFKLFAMIEKHFRFFISIRSIVDYIIVIPYWCGFSQPAVADLYGLGYFRVFRLFGIFRLLNFNEENDKYQYATLVLVQTIWRSSPAIAALMATATIFSIFFGSLMYIIEQGR